MYKIHQTTLLKLHVSRIGWGKNCDPSEAQVNISQINSSLPLKYFSFVISVSPSTQLQLKFECKDTKWHACEEIWHAGSLGTLLSKMDAINFLNTKLLASLTEL